MEHCGGHSTIKSPIFVFFIIMRNIFQLLHLQNMDLWYCCIASPPCSLQGVTHQAMQIHGFCGFVGSGFGSCAERSGGGGIKGSIIVSLILVLSHFWVCSIVTSVKDEEYSKILNTHSTHQWIIECCNGGHCCSTVQQEQKERVFSSENFRKNGRWWSKM